MDDSKTITILAVGDVCVNRENPYSIFTYVAPTIKSTDISFCQLETSYSEKGSILPQARVPLRAHPKNASAIKTAGFGAVSAVAHVTPAPAVVTANV